MDNDRIRFLINNATSRRLNDLVKLNIFLGGLGFALGVILNLLGSEGNWFGLGFMIANLLQLLVLMALRTALNWEVRNFNDEPPDSKNTR